MEIQPSSSQRLLSGQVPYSQEAEEATIGACLINPEIIHAVRLFLKADDFYVLRHAYIWEAIVRIINRKEQLDYLTLQEELRALGRLEEIGGSAYLTQILSACASSMHGETYAHLVERAAIRRRLLAAADEIRGLALDEELPIETVTKESSARVFKAIQHRKQDTYPLIEFINQAYDEAEAAMQNQGQTLPGVPTGIKTLDDRFGGLGASQLIALGARPAMGKSALAMNIAIHACLTSNPRTRSGRPFIGVFHSLEMSGKRLASRVLSSMSGVTTNVMRGGKFSQEEWSAFVRASGNAADAPLLINDNPHVDVIAWGNELRSISTAIGLDFAVLDYLQLMEVEETSTRRFSSREREVAYISREIKGLTLELGIPILTCAQLNRGLEARQDKRPQLADLRESGAIEQDSDMVWFLYRPIVYYPNDPNVPPSLAELIVAKNRDDTTGTVQLRFTKKLTKFEGVD